MAIPVTTPSCTIVQLATSLADAPLERAINEAVNRDLTDPDRLRTDVAAMTHRSGRRRILGLLDRDTYVVTDTRLEQRLLWIARRAGLPVPETQRHLDGGRVDFYWAALGLIVEADSLRFHRTPAQQRADRLRDQRHAAAGLVTLRFTHWQVFHEADHVEATLRAVAQRLAA
jgi:very-short-patch-repair endonuclease